MEVACKLGVVGSRVQRGCSMQCGHIYGVGEVTKAGPHRVHWPRSACWKLVSNQERDTHAGVVIIDWSSKISSMS